MPEFLCGSEACGELRAGINNGQFSSWIKRRKDIDPSDKSLFKYFETSSCPIDFYNETELKFNTG